jgi:hypothetical protein
MSKPKPNPKDAARCFDLRCRAKRGEALYPADREFVEKMFHDFPDWYGATEPEVFNRTIPFGSSRRAK